mmetsp:Transcript_36862/g.109467  ORF Transcript_36862/g.109467 Transcript_36862/m.109467 type:complete len:304 (-) Transcript_36862:175-1086(-)
MPARGRGLKNPPQLTDRKVGQHCLHPESVRPCCLPCPGPNKPLLAISTRATRADTVAGPWSPVKLQTKSSRPHLLSACQDVAAESAPLPRRRIWPPGHADAGAPSPPARDRRTSACNRASAAWTARLSPVTIPADCARAVRAADHARASVSSSSRARREARADSLPDAAISARARTAARRAHGSSCASRSRAALTACSQPCPAIWTKACTATCRTQSSSCSSCAPTWSAAALPPLSPSSARASSAWVCLKRLPLASSRRAASRETISVSGKLQLPSWQYTPRDSSSRRATSPSRRMAGSASSV